MGTTPINPDPSTPGTTTANPSTPFLDSIVKGNIVRDASAAVDDPANVRARNMVKEFGQQLKANPSFLNDVNSGDMVDAIEKRIAELDAEISLKLNSIMHHPGFQKIEATWRGLNYLVMKSETGDALKVRVLNATMDDLKTDIQKATEFDQSVLFKKIYEEEYGTFGGSPYSCLVGDYYFDGTAPSMNLLKGLAGVAAAAHAPFIAAASPALFDWESFTEMSNRRDLAKGFETAELAPWVGFRKSEDSRYVALALPRMLLRLPYGPNTNPVEEFEYGESRQRDPQVDPKGIATFIEDVDSKDHEEVPVGQRGLGARPTHRQGVLALSLVRRHPRRRRRRAGRPMVPFHTFKTDQGDVGAEVPHGNRPSRTAVRRS